MQRTLLAMARRLTDLMTGQKKKIFYFFGFYQHEWGNEKASATGATAPRLQSGGTLFQ
jgi:hypothetical protein